MQLTSVVKVTEGSRKGRAFSDMDKLDRSLDSIIGSSRHGPSRNIYGGHSRKIWRLCLSCSGGSRRNGRRENRQAKPYTRTAERGGRTVINTSSGEQSEHKVRSPGDAVPVARQPIDLPYPAQVSGQTPPKMLAGLIAARVRLAACLAAGGAQQRARMILWFAEGS